MAFSSMGAHWTAVRDGARAGTLRRGDESVAAVAARWDELLRYVALELTQELGRDVRNALGARERTPESRQAALQEALSERATLYAALAVPNAASLLELTADLRARQIFASTRLDAPQEGRSRGRLSWLLRQLERAPETLRVEARAAYSSNTLAATLGEVRTRPDALYPEGDRDIKEFVLTLSRTPGLNRDAGKGSFAESVIALTKDFYAQVLQPLRPWKEPAPKLVKRARAKDVQERIVEIMPAIADAVRTAQGEAPSVGAAEATPPAD